MPNFQCHMVTYTTCSRIPILFFSYVSIHIVFAYQEEFEDTKGVIRIRISKKNRQHKIDHLLSMNFNKGSMTTGDISRAKTGSFFIIRVHHWGSRWSICFIFCLYVGFFLSTIDCLFVPLSFFLWESYCMVSGYLLCYI